MGGTPGKLRLGHSLGDGMVIVWIEDVSTRCRFELPMEDFKQLMRAFWGPQHWRDDDIQGE